MYLKGYMKTQFQNLPSPDPEAVIHSEKLQNLLREEILNKGGSISFARFMELALYAPGLGYYVAGAQKFGRGGDFVTAAEISPLFSKCLARQCQQIIQYLCADGKALPEILEFGAGTGIMAADLLLELERLQALPSRYFILEISADLKERQQETFRAKIPHLLEKITWLNELPSEAFEGVVLANEVMDAMPVHRFRINSQGIQEFYVGWKEGEFILQLGQPECSRLTQSVETLAIEFENEGYDSEINLLLPGWIKSVAQCLKRGVVFLIDYGFPQREYYHPDRSTGTLMCHYRHRAHTDPLHLVGLQDITAHVDFTAIADAAIENDLQVAGFTSQAAFLLGCGLMDVAAGVQDIYSQLKTSQQIQVLTSPNEMGELFKVMALTKGMGGFSCCGFSLQDQRYRL